MFKEYGYIYTIGNSMKVEEKDSEKGSIHG